MRFRSLSLVSWCLTAILINLILVGLASGQQGRWVEYRPSEFGSGTEYYDRGDDCLIYTRAGSEYVLVFDAGVGDWLRIQTATVQTWQHASTDGQVALALGNSLLVGYSAELEQWDTITYTGALLPAAVASPPCYGCSAGLAFFMSDQALYVFDAGLGSWQQYAYTLPADFAAGRFLVKDDYFVAELRQDGALPANVVYSTYTRTFNETADGGWIYEPITSYGYSAVTGLNDVDHTYRLIGYSALTNQFSIVHWNATGQSCISGFLPSGDDADAYTAYSACFRESVTPYVLVTGDFFGYDSRRSAWTHYPVDFDWTEESYYGNCQVGGDFTVDIGTAGDGSMKFFLYSGDAGAYRVKTPGIVYKSTWFGWRSGGSIFMCYDTLQGWAYDPGADVGSLVNFDPGKTTNAHVGENWGTLSRYVEGDDSMTVYFYNTTTTTWLTTRMALKTSMSNTSYPNHLMFYNYTTGDMLYYSGLQHTIERRQFAPSTSVSDKMRGNLATASSDGISYLVNAATGDWFTENFRFNGTGLGVFSAAFYDDPARTLHGYSSLTGNWASQVIAEDPYMVHDTGCIGLYTMSGYNAFYAYNGFGDCFVGLNPEGSNSASYVGGKTALVKRSSPTILYAFDPEGIYLDVAEDNDRPLPATFEVSQNYPNPFNPSTMIDYALPYRADVKVAVFNLLGQKVRTLVDESQPAGSHSVEWDSTDDSGHEVASGVYFYRVEAGEFTETKKMVLVR